MIDVGLITLVFLFFFAFCLSIRFLLEKKADLATVAILAAIISFIGLVQIQVEEYEEFVAFGNAVTMFCVNEGWAGHERVLKESRVSVKYCYKCVKTVPHPSGLGEGSKEFSGCVDEEVKQNVEL